MTPPPKSLLAVLCVLAVNGLEFQNTSWPCLILNFVSFASFCSKLFFMSFLGIAGRTYLVTGVANKKSVAWHIAQTLEAEGARVIYSVRSEKRKDCLLYTSRCV